MQLTMTIIITTWLILVPGHSLATRYLERRYGFCSRCRRPYPDHPSKPLHQRERRQWKKIVDRESQS
jgi:hypothetical protein